MRSKLILLLAIVMGLMTTFLFFRYMDSFKTTTSDEAVVMADVIVASRDIKKNERISADLLKTVQIVEEGLYPGSIVDPDAVIGKYALADIGEGEPFVQQRIRDEKEETLFVSRKIAENKRAVSLGLNFVQSVSNMIEPEDTVDVIFTKLGKPELGIETVSVLLMQNVRVLAVGRRMVEVVEGDEYAEYSSVTLELSAQDTVKVVNAANDGIITLTLNTRIVTKK